MKSKIELTSFSPIITDSEARPGKGSVVELESVKSLLSSPSTNAMPLVQSDSEDQPSKNGTVRKEKSGGKGFDEDKDEKANYRQDLPSILLLFLLYILQGIPLGIMSTIPFLLQTRNVPYTEQAQFSIAGWPFGLKVLYAPIVDSFYFKRFGRRKSWLIPLQYLIAVFLFALSFRIEALLDSVQVTVITIVFFILNFLCATQDITVDGWALTMLQRKNVGYAATCNAVGQTLGAVMGYSGFLALNSASFANKYFRSEPLPTGLVSLPEFLFFWAVVFAVTTTGVLIFKREGKESEEINDQHMDICASYTNLWKILKLRNIQYLMAFYLTVKMGTAATDAMARLKLVENGVPKEWVAFFAIPLIPFKLLLPLIISRYTVGSNAMGVYINAVPFNLLFGIIFPLFILWTPSFQMENGEFPTYYYTILFCVFALQILPSYTMFVSGMAFSAKVSDPAIGGTYMTLINTISNVGGMWTTTAALWLVDYVAIYIKACAGLVHDVFTNSIKNQTERNLSFVLNGTLTSPNVGMTYETIPPHNLTTDVSNNGSRVLATPVEDPCIVKIDGYYVESVVCVLIGFLWLAWGRPTILRLQGKPIATWRVFK